jgi:hypothetical protein
MDMAIIAIGFGFLLLLTYVLYRLLSDESPKLDERSVKAGRLMGMPKFFAPIFAKPLTKREKIGWLVFLVILVLGVLFTRLTGLGAGR